MSHPRSKVHAEEAMIRRRESEAEHQREWTDRVRYYETFDRANVNHDRWTSSDYYATSAQHMDDANKKHDREELQAQRRDKLTKLYRDEEESDRVELIRARNRPSTSKTDDIPTELLDAVNKGLKLDAEDQRKHRAELGLYEQWRQNSHAVRDHERRVQSADVKLSWLDKQIDKRMERERVEEECRQMVAERERSLAQHLEEEQSYKRYVEERQEQLKNGLDKQIAELEEKKRQCKEVEAKDAELARLIDELETIEAKREEDAKRQEERDIVLFNVKQHKLRIKQQAIEAEQRVEDARRFAEELIRLRLEDQLEKEREVADAHRTLTEFIELAAQQKRLEKKRQEKLDFVFESEAKAMYEEQCAMWRKEEAARTALLRDALDTIKKQVAVKREERKKEGRKLLQEREDILKDIERFNAEMEQLKQEEVQKVIHYKDIIYKQRKERDLHRKQLRLLEQKDGEKELEASRKEEERLKHEIMNLQRREKPSRPGTHRYF